INIALTWRFMGRLESGKPAFPRIISQGVFSNFKPALDYYERSLKISQKIGDEEGELTTLKEIGLVYQVQYKLPNNLEKAMSYFEPLRIRLKDSNYRRLYAVVLNNIATNEYNSGRADTNGLGIADKAKFDKSIETADEAAQIFREIGDRQELREMLDRKAFCRHYLERYSEALPFIDESIRIAEELYYQPVGDALDRSRYFESLIGSYRQKMDALYKLNRPAEMFETHEAMKSMALRDLMNRRRDTGKLVLTADETVEEKRLNDELNSINRQLLQIKQIDKSANKQFAELNRRLQKTRLAKEEWQANTASENEKDNPPIRAQNLNIAQICALVPDKNTAFIEYEANKDHHGATFVLMKTDADFDPLTQIKKLTIKNLLSEKITLPDGQTCSINVYFNKDWWENEKYSEWYMELAERMSEFRDQIARNSPAFKANARFIYDGLLADGMPLFKDKKHLVIVPSGVTCDVPFQALMNENGRYLIEDYSISYAPSLTTLAEMQANRRKLATQKYVGDFLAFGNPKLSAETAAKLRVRYRSGKLENLPEAEVEVNTIGKFYPNNKILTGGNATETVWQTEASKYRILHLATHGLSDAEKPLYSHVLLSANLDDDGLIEGREIAAMNLTAEMVVLSACETARGREFDGEGMVGLAWSFAAAGVSTVIASNWKVDSAVTAEFMIDFYSELNDKNNQTKNEALRTAALKKLKSEKTTHPFYWAGFALFGDWEN
ncbi:MAG: CHAT domain-containing protein, partial [Pyrinomonadaceae bacterium]|nr:CHAT domain-containing protein [Pyrinomonadaceae bacterium]